jgi:hypothetical protein
MMWMMITVLMQYKLTVLLKKNANAKRNIFVKRKYKFVVRFKTKINVGTQDIPIFNSLSIIHLALIHVVISLVI